MLHSMLSIRPDLSVPLPLIERYPTSVMKHDFMMLL